MRLGLIAAGLTGLFLATILVGWYGAAEVAGALAVVGWRGIAVVALVHLASILLCALGWRVLLPRENGSVAICAYARWVREGVGNLLGVLPVAGEIVGARLLVMVGLPRRPAVASVVADLATETLSQATFTLLGLALLLADHAEVAAEWALTIAGASIPALSVLFVVRSRRALGLVDRMAQALARSLKVELAGEPATLAETVHEVFRRRAAIALSFLAHLASWLVGGVETWLVLGFMGHPAEFDDALIIESLMWAIRGAVFIVPSGVGIQEAGYVLVASLFGLSPELALALSLVKRARDLVLGLPALALWQTAESTRIRRAIHARLMQHNS
jgi:putative membrane protein